MKIKYFLCIILLSCAHSKKRRRMNDNKKYKVKLRVYDLMQDFEKKVISTLLNVEIDKIYHTSLEIYKKEFWFGNGVFSSEPGKSGHGEPIEIIDMGKTEIDEDTFVDFYTYGLDEKYAKGKYHLLLNNCNNFTNDMLIFLVKNEIPKEISDLPKIVLESKVFQSFFKHLFPSTPE